MLKDNWPTVRERYQAFWGGGEVDRPPVLFDVPHPMYRGAGYDYTRYGEDSAAFCRDFRAVWEARAAFPDDTIPCLAPQLGGALEAALLAGKIHWGEEISSLQPPPPLASEPDLAAVGFSPDNPYYQRVRRELQYFAEDSGGDYGINVEASMSLTTTLSQLRGGTQFMFDVVDQPEAVRALAETALEALLAVHAEVVRLNPLPEGMAHRWLNYWNPGTSLWFSEDDAVMLSPERYRDLFLDLDRRLCEAVDFAVVHWHTAGLHLVPVLLQIPNLRMVQISFDPNGPDLETTLQTCREIAETGRKVCFQMGYHRDLVRRIFAAVGPSACMFYFGAAPSVAQAGRILGEVERQAAAKGVTRIGA